MSDTRTRLRHEIERRPGLHFNELVRTLELAPGQVQYHVRTLISEGRVREASYYGRTHYYPPDCEAWERGALALARRETARDVLFELLENDGARPGAVADSLGIARSTLEWHLDHLIAEGVVEKERDARNRVTLALTEPEATVEVLGRIEPSLPERLVDRFERLLDGLLEG
jgi:predicted transcriptional regulator